MNIPKHWRTHPLPPHVVSEASVFTQETGAVSHRKGSRMQNSLQRLCHTDCCKAAHHSFHSSRHLHTWHVWYNDRKTSGLSYYALFILLCHKWLFMVISSALRSSTCQRRGCIEAHSTHRTGERPDEELVPKTEPTSCIMDLVFDMKSLRWRLYSTFTLQTNRLIKTTPHQRCNVGLKVDVRWIQHDQLKSWSVSTCDEKRQGNSGSAVWE